MQGVIYVDCGVFTHVRGGGSLDCKVGDPIMDLVVTRHGKDSLIAVEGMADFK